MKAHHLIAAAGILILAASCSTARSGTPGPTEQRTSGTSSTDAPSSPVLPPRPRDLDLTDVDPCTDPLTDEQLRELVYDLGSARPPTSGNSDIHGGPVCVYASTLPIDQTGRDLRTAVGISTTEGAEAWLTDPRRSGGAALATQTTVDGFPALVLPHLEVTPNCMVVVDTADRQYLEVTASKRSSRQAPSVEPYCAEAERVAGMAIQTLSASR